METFSLRSMNYSQKLDLFPLIILQDYGRCSNQHIVYFSLWSTHTHTQSDAWEVHNYSISNTASNLPWMNFWKKLVLFSLIIFLIHVNLHGICIFWSKSPHQHQSPTIHNENKLPFFNLKSKEATKKFVQITREKQKHVIGTIDVFPFPYIAIGQAKIVGSMPTTVSPTWQGRNYNKERILM